MRCLLAPLCLSPTEAPVSCRQRSSGCLQLLSGGGQWALHRLASHSSSSQHSYRLMPPHGPLLMPAPAASPRVLLGRLMACTMPGIGNPSPLLCTNSIGTGLTSLSIAKSIDSLFCWLPKGGWQAKSCRRLGQPSPRAAPQPHPQVGAWEALSC